MIVLISAVAVECSGGQVASSATSTLPRPRLRSLLRLRVLLEWFMFRLERILIRFDKAVLLMARATIRLLERADPEEASSLSKALSREDG